MKTKTLRMVLGRSSVALAVTATLAAHASSVNTRVSEQTSRELEQAAVEAQRAARDGLQAAQKALRAASAEIKAKAAQEKESSKDFATQFEGSVQKIVGVSLGKAAEALDAVGPEIEQIVASVDLNEIRETVRRSMEEANGSSAWSYRTGGDEVQKGNPYSSRETREFKQTLSDGTVISRQSTRLLARDGAGRTRQELRQPDGTARIFINDPVAKRAHIIEPQKRIVCSANFDKYAINDCFKKLRGDWKPLGFSFSPTNRGIPIMTANDDVRIHVSSNAKVIDLTEGQNASGRGKTFSWSSSGPGAVNVAPPVPPVPPVTPVPPVPPLPGQTVRDSKVVRETSTTTYEGLRVDVTRNVETIAAGAMGNNRPIENVFERYYSPDLKMTVYSKRSDPRSGESIYRMSEIKRSEPDPDLFRVPAGFAETEGKSK